MARARDFVAALLLALVSQAGGVDCSPGKLSAANTLFDTVISKGLNLALQRVLSKTLGDCQTATDPSLQPCKNNNIFPINKSGYDYTANINYLTHLDTIGVAGFSLECGGEGDKHWFAALKVHIGEIAVAIHAQTTFPPVTLDAPCTPESSCMVDEKDLELHVSARLRCHNSTHLWVNLNNDGLVLSGALTVMLPGGISLDLTTLIFPVVRQKMDGQLLKCPKGLEHLCWSVCGETPDPATPGWCSPDSGGTCHMASCSASRGPTVCFAGHCLCAQGTCADPNGACLPAPAPSPCEQDAGDSCYLSGCSESLGPTRCEGHECLCSDDTCFSDGKCARPPKQQVSCPTDTGGSCMFAGCSPSRGPTVCERYRCICAEGYCLVAGRCVAVDGAVELLAISESTGGAQVIGALAVSVAIAFVFALVMARVVRTRTAAVTQDYMKLEA